MAIQRTGGPPSALTVRRRAQPPRSWTSAGLLVAAAGVGAYLFYAPAYVLHHYPEPLGFDTSWYIWHARFAAARGIGPLDTASRPGTSLLEAVTGSVTRQSQPILSVVVPIVLVAVFALAMGAFSVAIFRRSERRFALTTAVAIVLLGATRLLSENVATLLLLALAVAALTAIARRAAGERGLAGSIVLLAAGGIAHWLFLAVLLAALAVAAALRLPAALRGRRDGTPWLRTDSGLLATVAASAGAIVAATIALILRVPFSTIEMSEPPWRLPQKLRTDVARLRFPLTIPVAAMGAFSLLRPDDRPPGRATKPSGPRSMGLAILSGWTIVCGLGVIYGVVTKNLPPHRFFELAVAVPGVILLAEGIEWAVTWVQRWAERRRVTHEPSGASPNGNRRRRWVGGAVALIGVGLLAFPGFVTWYRGGPGMWIKEPALQEATAAAGYVRSLPAGRPFVFLVSQQGIAGTLSTTLDERTIRLALPPDRQQGLYVYAGDLADLLAGRQTTSADPFMNKAIRPFWDGTRRVLPQRPSILIVKALANEEFARTLASGGRLVAPGVAILVRGADPPAPNALPVPPPPHDVPSPAVGVLLAAVVMALLAGCGIGWSMLAFGRRADPLITFGSAPAVGAAAVILAALVPARAGVGIGGPVGIAIVAVVAIAGWALAWRDARRGTDGAPS